MELVHARVVQNSCPECLNVRLEEAKSDEKINLRGSVVIIPKDWLNAMCPHGHSGLKFEFLAVADTDALSQGGEQAGSGEVELDTIDSRMDGTKDIGYPVREHWPYGSHPMCDPFDDESGPDGAGTY